MIPPQAPRPGALTSFAHLPSCTAAPRRVLIVEDGLDAVHALAVLVTDMGHEVKFAINGYAALEIARKFKPHFVFLDLGLPGMDGFEVCRRIKSEDSLVRTRVIALTAYAQDEYRVRARAAGCELHLLKPVPAQILFDVLESSVPDEPSAVVAPR